MKRKNISAILEDGILIQSKCPELSNDQILKIDSLIEIIWPEESTPGDSKSKIQSFHKKNKIAEVLLIESGDQLIGHTKIFPRTLFAESKSLEVIALGGVCVLDEFRKYGLGKLMVKEVFELIDKENYPICLFQTTIPKFYEKLGARIINNRFFNSKNPVQPQISPWHDPYVMIYPADASWPECDLDLNGSEF